MKTIRFALPGALILLLLTFLAAGPAAPTQDPPCPTCGPAGEPEAERAFTVVVTLHERRLDRADLLLAHHDALPIEQYDARRIAISFAVAQHNRLPLLV